MTRFVGILAGGLLCSGLVSQLAAAPVGGVARFQFKEQGLRSYRVEVGGGVVATAQKQSAAGGEWIKAWREGSEDNPCQVGSRVVVRLKTPDLLDELVKGRPLQLEERMMDDFFVLRASSALTAIQQAQELAQVAGVLASYPEMRRPIARHFVYAPEPDDPYFSDENTFGVVGQWHLENRDGAGVRAGIDLNVRSAWPFTRGEGVVVAVVDDGVELTHPDFIGIGATELHFNFNLDAPGGLPASSLQDHGTAVAGLIFAEGNNGEGVSGVAPGAHFASWPIFDSRDFIASDLQLAKAFGYESNQVAVQNHSWGNAAVNQLEPSLAEQMSVSNAATMGRNGRGVVIVRSGGNNRENGGNTNDDGYPNVPHVIAVAAIRDDGRAASYSNPGACLLVGAPSGDTGFRLLTTTDRLGNIGLNRANSIGDLGDYAYGKTGFSGTSGSAPQISGIAALLISANPSLTVRDVQQILIHSARQRDAGDPDARENGAGFAFSHNSGFGVPDAGHAVRLALSWSNRPSAVARLVYSANLQQAIPDDGLRVALQGMAPIAVASVPSTPSVGIVPDEPTETAPLVDVGQALTPIMQDLTGKGALIQRGENFFSEKIDFAAAAGAEFAVIYNNRDSDQRITMAATDYTTIPAVFISQIDGEGLRDHIATNGTALARLELLKTAAPIVVTDSLLLEHVGLRIRTDHPRRGDVRVTLVSPMGTRSVMQRVNFDNAPGPFDWTYYSTQHFYESSAGVWTAELSDAQPEEAGSLTMVELILRGVPIIDADTDGLDDGWEQSFFGGLARGAKGDEDDDGYSNAREQIMGTDPTVANEELRLNVSPLRTDSLRLSWPSRTNRNYEVLSTLDLGTTWTTNTFAGEFPETEHILNSSVLERQFIRIQEVAP